MSLFIIAAALLAWKYPVAALIVAATAGEYLMTNRRTIDRLCQIPGCTQTALLHLRVCSSHKESQAVGMRPKSMHSTHPCPIPGCKQVTAYGKLMCWEHWGMTPAAQRKAVWASWNEGQPLPSHPRACINAIDAVKGVISRKRN